MTVQLVSSLLMSLSTGVTGTHIPPCQTIPRHSLACKNYSQTVSQVQFSVQKLQQNHTLVKFGYNFCMSNYTRVCFGVQKCSQTIPRQNNILCTPLLFRLYVQLFIRLILNTFSNGTNKYRIYDDKCTFMFNLHSYHCQCLRWVGRHG